MSLVCAGGILNVECELNWKSRLALEDTVYAHRSQQETCMLIEWNICAQRDPITHIHHAHPVCLRLTKLCLSLVQSLPLLSALTCRGHSFHICDEIVSTHPSI